LISPEAVEVMRTRALLALGLSYSDLSIIPSEEAEALLMLEQEINKKEKEDIKKAK